LLEMRTVRTLNPYADSKRSRPGAAWSLSYQASIGIILSCWESRRDVTTYPTALALNEVKGKWWEHGPSTKRKPRQG
jgi:hypothetical protein